MVWLLAAPWVQLSVSAGNGWPRNALRHHWLMPISCHFRDCKALLVTSLTRVSGAIASVQTFTFTCRSHNRRRTIECLFVTACSMDQYAEEKRTEKNLIVRSGISEAETNNNNKRLRSTFCIEAIQTRNIARPLCDSRASCFLSVGIHVAKQLMQLKDN